MLEGIVTGHYELWRGLDPQPTLQQLAASVGPITALPPQAMNRIATRFLVSRIERHAPPFHLEAWIPIDSDQIAILEVEDPVCADVESTLSKMGPPETILQDQRVSAEYLVLECVFPSWGINLSIGEPLDRSLHLQRRLLHVRLFPSMSLQRYLTDVGEPVPTLPRTNV